MPVPETHVAFPSQADAAYQVGDGRVWVKPERDDPFGFLGCFGAGGFTWTQPDVTPVWCPDPTRYRKFKQVDTIEGVPSLPETSIMGRSTAVQFLWDLVRKGCPLHIDVRYAHSGRPDDPDGWQTIRRFCNSRITDYSSDDQVVLNENAEIMETISVTAELMHIIRRLKADEIVDSLPVDLTAVVACDVLTCGDCVNDPSDGCERWVAGSAAWGGAPYIGISTDRGTNWTWRMITPWILGENVSDLACLGDRIIVITGERGALAYSDDDGLTWTEVTVGFLPGGDGRAMFALDPRHIWIVGEAGAIYFTSDVPTGLVVQEDGSLTTENLNDVVFVNSQDGYAVGDNNTFLFTINGGDTWEARTGPVAQDLMSLVAYHSKTMCMVLVGAADGTLWQSFDAGVTWEQRTQFVTGAYNIPSITYCGCGGLELFLLREVGTYLSPTDGELWRSIDGGITWQEIELPTNVGVEDVACCSPNGAIVVGSVTATGVGLIAVVS